MLQNFERLAYWELTQFVDHTRDFYEPVIVVSPPLGIHEDDHSPLTEDQRHQCRIAYNGSITIDCRKPLLEEFKRAFSEIATVFEFAAGLLDQIDQADVDEWLNWEVSA